uniref:Endogenous alpha-amylase/subtilisin inhibitor n=1 Tax=Aegilops tauschii TaxID=37682 RepID=R7W4S0_AEGTA
MSSRRVGLLFISLLALALSCSADPPPVHDTDGNELRADANYYVLPANRAHGGGLTMAPGHGRRCPLFVSQEADGQRDGLPDLGVFRDLKGGAWFLGATEPYHVVVFKKAPPA